MVLSLVLVCLAIAANAVAAVPLPARPAGSGSETLHASGLISGTQLRIRGALVWTDGFGDLTLLLSPETRSCKSLSAEPAETKPYVWAWIHSGGPALQIGRPITGTGAIRTVVNFVTGAGKHPVSVHNRVQVVMTRIDTRANGVWHGRVRVDSRRVGSERFSLTGTFAARWCGQQ